MTTPDRADDGVHFRHVLGHVPTGVVVIAAVAADGQPVGMAVGSFISVSLSPQLIAFLPAKSSTSFPRIRSAKSFCVNVLGADQLDVCHAFAARGGDKFAQISWTPAASGAPIIDGVVAWIDCELYEVREAGDHFIVVGRVRSLQARDGAVPLAFVHGTYKGFTDPLALVDGVPSATS